MTIFNHVTKEFSFVSDGANITQRHCVTPFVGDQCPDCKVKGLYKELLEAVHGVSAAPTPTPAKKEKAVAYVAPVAAAEPESEVSEVVEPDPEPIVETPKAKAKK